MKTDRRTSVVHVAAELRRYMDLGFSTFILDIPGSEEELHHIGVAFRAAQEARR